MAVSRKRAAEDRKNALESARIERLAGAIGREVAKNLLSLKDEIRPPSPAVEPAMVSQLRQYSFGMQRTIHCGESLRFRMISSPPRAFTPSSIIVNAPCVGFFILHEMRIAHHRLLIGGSEDGLNYSPPNSRYLGLPELSRYDDVEFDVEYTGFCPPPLHHGMDYLCSIQLVGRGPAE